MAKAIVCISSAALISDKASISYSVVILGPPNYSYSADYEVDTAKSLPNNLLDWRNKIVDHAKEKNIILLPNDVIVFGGPS